MEYVKQNNLKYLKKIINKDRYDKILIVTGKNSFSKSGSIIPSFHQVEHLL